MSPPEEAARLVTTEELNRRLDARWSKIVLAQGYTVIPALLISGQGRLGLTPEEFNVVIQLAYHWRTVGNDPFPTKKRIASLMGKSEKQVQRYFKSLEMKGYVTRQERFSRNRGQMSNSYDMSGLVIRLRELAAEDRVLSRNAPSHEGGD